ncbi:MAG TPA: twin-arginine translocase TatA/TatE family subunit [Acidimicrobiales bacterium]|nr:twin-arginine translocase TatA/TatE family subunit [Acidimicrobiales bacterium]
MGSIGPAEIIVVLIVGLIVLGPNRLPEAARQVGKAFSEFKRVSAGLQAEVRDAFTEPVVSTPSTPPATQSTQGMAEIAPQATSEPAPWANPAIPVEGPARGRAEGPSPNGPSPSPNDPEH